METVRIRKTVLIKKLKENKAKHDKLLDQATLRYFTGIPKNNYSVKHLEKRKRQKLKNPGQ